VYAATKTPITLTADIRSGFNDWGSLSANYNFADPANFDYATYWWGGGGGYVQEASIDDKMRNARLTAKRDLDWGIFSSFEGGLIYSRREKAVHYLGYNMLLVNPDQSSACIHYYSWDAGSGCAPIPASILQAPVNLGFAGIPSLISFNVDDALAGSAFVRDTNISRNPTWNWGVRESITRLYLKSGLKFHLGIPFHGNLGVQVVNTDQSSDGTQDDGNGGQFPVHGGAKYTDVLPSLNLVGDFGHGTLLKLGVAKVQARPEMIYMQANFTAGVNTTDLKWYGSGGNPTLKPWRANEFDLSIEKYFAPATYVALATFYKQITTGIYVQSVPFDFTGFTNTTPIPPGKKVDPIGLLSAPANTNGGHVDGWEASGAVELGAFTPALKGLGFTGSFSNTSSNLPGTDIYGNKTTTQLPGLSGQVSSLSVYYERAGWQFRIGNRYRSAFVAKRHDSFKNVVDSIRPENIVDAQLGYTIQSGTLSDLNILLQVDNLTDAAYVTTQTVDGVEALKERHTFGRQYLLGASYKF
jgi:iron complex outermembrane receptor protein